MKRRRLVVVIALLAMASASPRTQADPSALARDGYALLAKSQLAEARKRFEAAIPLAKDQGNRQAEADALRGLGTVLYQLGRWNDAPAPLQSAIALYGALGDRAGEARALDQLGSAGAMTRRPDAGASYERAIAMFSELGDRVEQARTIRNRSHLQNVPLTEKIAMLQDALTLAEGDGRLQGLILHSLGSLDQTRGRFASAIAYFERAEPLLKAAGTPREQARLSSSLAGATHFHGQSQRAIEIYLQAIALLEQIGDVPAIAQTLNTLADSYVVTGQLQRALAARERALELAKKVGSPGMIATAQGTLGQAYVALGQYDKAISVMEEALGRDLNPDVTTGFYRNLAKAYAGAGRMDDALRFATRGVELSRERDRIQNEMLALQTRSTIHEQMGKIDLALADARAGLDTLERLRANLAPDDYLKGGFADTFQSLFAQTVALLDAVGRTSEAVVVAEQARARAFLDLLATRETEVDDAGQSAPLTMRGTPVSAASAPVPTEVTIRSAASRLQSTLLSFWVGSDATFVWVTAADGKVTSHRVPASRARLQRLVRRTWSMGASALASRGASDGDAESDAAPQPEPVERALSYVTLRGGEPLAPTGLERSAYRELYDLLIQPVRHALPKAPDSLLTVVPHGPLFELSFAALSDRRGRHLLEDFRLHYAPSAATLEFTARQLRPATPSARLLFVANPQTVAATASQPLAALPGAEREVKAVSQLFGPRQTTLLIGPAATESAVTSGIDRYRVVHFATHGLVSSDRPLDSFLALSPGKGDGRLTANEIYSLNLSADLVVLSACRAAGGRISGDGILGLTRAFFSAGTPSIVAALWDIADESAEHLLPRFYREWQKRDDKGAALRAAQLTMLRDLRAGKVTVSTPFGSMALPPHPALWANLVLIGEPR